MVRPHGILTIAACLAWSCTTVFAQPYTGNKNAPKPGNQGKVPKDRGIGGDRDEGTEYGTIVTIRAYGALNSDKIGQISIHTNMGKQVNVHLTDRTRYMLAGADMDHEMANALLVKDVPVTLQWRYSAETGGKLAYSIEVRTVPIQGTIKKANKRQVTVLALPIAHEEESEPVAPPIHAGGRKIADPPKKPAAKAPVPKTLNLIIRDQFTRVSVNGEKADAAAIKPKMSFDAIVVDGGPRWVVEINARTEDGQSATTGEKEGDTGKTDAGAKPVKPGKPKPTDKPKPPSE